MRKKTREVIVIRRLSIRDSIVNSIPMILGAFFWFIITWSGISYIRIEFFNNAMHPIVLLMWILMMTQIAGKMIPCGSTTYEVEESEVS